MNAQLFILSYTKIFHTSSSIGFQNQSRNRNLVIKILVHDWFRSCVTWAIPMHEYAPFLQVEGYVVLRLDREQLVNFTI